MVKGSTICQRNGIINKDGKYYLDEVYQFKPKKHASSNATGLTLQCNIIDFMNFRQIYDKVKKFSPLGFH